MADASDAAEIARARAEARRQKILARQKDRLSAITGVYSQPAEDTPEPSSRAAPATIAAPQPIQAPPATSSSSLGPAAATTAPAAASEDATPSEVAAHEQQQLEAMLQSLHASIQQAQAAAAAPSVNNASLMTHDDASSGGTRPASQQQQQQRWRQGRPATPEIDADAANAAMQTLLAGMAGLSGHDNLLTTIGGSVAPEIDAAGASDGAAAAASAPGAQRRGDDVLSAFQRDAPGVLLWLGRVLGVLVQQTQQVRLLTAALIGYAAVAGVLQQQGPWGAIRPAVVLLVTQACIVAAAVVLLGRRAARRVAEQDGQYGGGPGEAVRLPMRLRQFDVLSYMPGAREALAGLEGYRQLVNGLSEDVAVYLLVCGLLSLSAKS